MASMSHRDQVHTGTLLGMKRKWRVESNFGMQNILQELFKFLGAEYI